MLKAGAGPPDRSTDSNGSPTEGDTGVATSVIGLDIGTTRVRAVEVQHSRGTPTVVRYAESPVPLGAVRDGEVTERDGVVHALRDLWQRGRFSHKDVVLGVGNQRVLVRSLDLPWMPMAQVRASLPFQVQDTLPVPVEDALLDYYPTAEYTGPNGRSLSGLLVAATRDTVNANVSAVESAGLRPRMVDLNAFALVRAHMQGDLARSTVALVDIGARITNVVITEQGSPRLVRVLPVGAQNVTDAVAAAVGVPASEAEMIKRQVGVGFGAAPELQAVADAVNQVTRTLVESIRNTFVYYASNNPGRAAEVVVLTGGGAYQNGLGQYLSSASRMPVAMGDALSSMNVARTADLSAVAGTESTVTIPLGLALGVAA